MGYWAAEAFGRFFIGDYLVELTALPERLSRNELVRARGLGVQVAVSGARMARITYVDAPGGQA